MSNAIKNAGYIYVLVNSSMPDLVKVGRTNRKPSERAQELSGVTGVPTPFIVAYEISVTDSEEAEKFIHTFMSRKGYRVSENREFFRAPVTEAVSAIMALPNRLINNTTFDHEDDDLLSGDYPDELDGLTLTDDVSFSFPPWWDIWMEGQKYLYGLDDYIQDYAEAMKYYKDAARLGSSFAYYSIGDMYQCGDGIPVNKNKALEYFKEGAKRGHYLCYMRMAYLFNGDKNIDNAVKCFNLGLSGMDNSNDAIFIEQNFGFVDIVCVFLGNTQFLEHLSSDAISKLNKMNKDLLQTCDDLIASNKRNDGQDRSKIIQGYAEIKSRLKNLYLKAVANTM